MESLKLFQIRKFCASHKFIALRDGNNDWHGINCKILFMQRMKDKPNINTKYYSWKEIYFSEYIRIKAPFM